MLFSTWWARTILTGVAYVVAGELALLWALPPDHAATIWPAAGIALVAVERWGASAALGVIGGSLAINAMHGDAAIGALLAVGAGLRAIVGAGLIRRFVSDDTLTHGRDVVAYVVLGGPVACLVGATWATAVLWLCGLVAAAGLPFTWFSGWVGETIGVVLIAPVLLALLGEPRGSWRPRLWSVAVPLLLTCVGMVLAFAVASRAKRDKAAAELAVRATVIAHAIEQRVARYTDAVGAAASFVAANPAITREQFAMFASGGLGRDSDVVALGWAPQITRETRAAFEAAQRALDPSFALYAYADTGTRPAPDVPELFPVAFIEPSTRLRGIDVSSEPSRAEAIARARATRTPAATKPLRLLDGTRGFLVVAPVFADARDPRALSGVTIGGFGGTALVAGATKGLNTEHLWLTLFDVTSGELEPLASTWFEAREWTQELEVAGRTWRLGVAFVGPAVVGWQTWLLLSAGLVFATMLATVLLAITGGSARVAAAEARYRDLYENAPDMYFTLRAGDAVILDCNATACLELGFPQHELVGMSLADLVEPSSREAFERGFETLARTGAATIPHIAVRCKDAHLVDASVTATAIYEGGEVVAARALLRSVTELVEAERDDRFQVELGDALHTSESIHAVMARAAARISEYLGVELCHYGEIDAAAGTVLVQQYSHGERESEEVVAVSAVEGIGLGELLRGVRYVVEDVALDPRTSAVASTAYAPRRLNSFIAIPLMRSGVCVAYFAVISATPRAWTPRDISLVQSVAERTWLWSEHLRSVHNLRDLSKFLEERVEERTRDLVAAVGEKEALLKEIHHRVKNNLQVISSMLNLQARRLRDRELASAFEESQQRIHTIALVHERLYQSRDLSNIGFDDYLKSLVANIMYAQNAGERGISADVEIAGISLPIQRAIPCGLIVNELITNAVKHAFPHGNGGTIRVSMKSVGDRIELVIADDGVGLPPGLDLSKSDSLGLDLVHAFAEQLDAELEVCSEHGASFTLRFAAS